MKSRAESTQDLVRPAGEESSPKGPGVTGCASGGERPSSVRTQSGGTHGPMPWDAALRGAGCTLQAGLWPRHPLSEPTGPGARLTHLLAGRLRQGLLATLLSAPQEGAPSPARQSSFPAGEDRTLGWRQKCGILGRIWM